MKKPSMCKFFVAATALAVVVLPGRLSAQYQIIEFNAPNAGTVSLPACAPSCGTLAFSSNDLGVVVGYYTDTKIVPHGFLRTPDGHFTSFDAPGAGLGNGLDQGTVAYAINDQGVIAGQLQDSSYVFHGFVRYPNGFFVTFDAPGAGTEADQGTVGQAINQAGQVAGYYQAANNVYHGFLRLADGTITTFDAPGAGTGPYQGTVPANGAAISPAGTIVGWYTDANYVMHGFLRAPDGSFTTIDPPGAGEGQSLGALVGGITPGGETTGYYFDAYNVLHGFVRNPDGAFTIFNAPGAGTGTLQGTAAFKINQENAITGIYVDSSNVLHGFVRNPDGAFSTFEAPGAGQEASSPGCFCQGTRPEAINQAGVSAGYYIDQNNVNHGFAYIPAWNR